MYYSSKAIDQLDRIFRLNLINSITGIKPANLVGTKSASGESNLAIISSVVHLGSNPALIGFVMRPSQEIERHTFDNIAQNGWYTINHVESSNTMAAHYTSAKFDRSVSEFKACGFTEEYLNDFHAPFVGESKIKMGLSLEEVVDINLNNTKMLIGKIQHIYLPDHVVDVEGMIDLAEARSVGVSGLNSYFGFQKIGDYPYARVSDWTKRDEE